jgi:hypothetical protein
MRLLPLFLICLFSCSEEPTITKHNVNVDSLLQRSKTNQINANEASKKSDTAISTKVTKTAEKIVKMEGEIKQLKEENNELKSNLDDASDVGQPFKLLPVSDN